MSAALSELELSQAFTSAVAVNGVHADMDTTLNDGDTLHIFPPAAGG